MKGNFTFRICEQNSSVIARFEILPWLYGPEKFPGLSRKGALERLGDKNGLGPSGSRSLHL